MIYSLCTACASQYISSPMNTPLFSEKGEVLVEAGVSPNSIFANGSYAFSKKYAAIASCDVSFRNFSDAADIFSATAGGETAIFAFGGDEAHRAFEAGVGRFNLLKSEDLLFETFAGIRYGSSISPNNEYPTEGPEYYNKAQYLQGFIQANFGKKRKWYEFGWAARMAYSYHDENDVELRSSYMYIHRNYSMIHLEPLCFAHVGCEHIKFTMRAGFHAGVYLGANFSELLYGNPHISAGLSVRF